MSKIALRVRELDTGVERNVEFEDFASARQWLLQRPALVEALGVASEIDHETSLALKAAMRPLDESELRAQHALDVAAAELQAKRAREAQTATALAAEAQRSAAREADPNRPMQIRWTYDHGMTVAERHDERDITATAREAVLAWIAERNEWVIDRGQMVGECTVTVWPNAVPAGKECVLHGSFIPVTAPTAPSRPKPN